MKIIAYYNNFQNSRRSEDDKIQHGGAAAFDIERVLLEDGDIWERILVKDRVSQEYKWSSWRLYIKSENIKGL